jgi:LysM repeat protein
VKAYTLFLILFSFQLLGQTLSDVPAIEIEYSEEDGVYYAHTIEAGNTLYSLSKLFQVSIEDILALNQWTGKKRLQIGEEVKIPFDDALLYKGASIDEFTDAQFLPVYYTIKPKETLYRVSRVYFGQDIELILQRNNLLGTHLDIDQKLLMGWIPVEDFTAITSVEKNTSPTKEDLPKDNKTIDSTAVFVEVKTFKDTLDATSIVLSELEQSEVLINTSIDSVERMADLIIAEEEVEIQVQQVETGIAYWNKKGSDNFNLFVLHPTAKINSLIEIYNPQLQRKTFAKVLGRIPDNMYAENIDLIVSPAVAKVLGVFNSEFRVTMKYYN